MPRTPLRLLWASALLFVPTVCTAAGLIADDTIAGLGATIELSALAANSNVTVIVQTPNGEALSLPSQADSKGDAIVAVKARDTEYAGLYSVEAFVAGKTVAGPVDFEVLPDTVDTAASDIRVLTLSIEADGEDEAEVVVTLRDRFGNPLPGRPVTLVPSRGADIVRTITLQTDARGAQRFGVSTEKPGIIAIRALDLLSGFAISDSAQIEAGSMVGGEVAQSRIAPASYGSALRAQLGEFDIIDSFKIIAPATLETGVEAPKITIQAVDQDGNVVQDYVGTILFSTPDDPESQLPLFDKYTFKESDQGQKEFNLVIKFNTDGMQMLRVEDENDSRIFGEETIDVTGSSHGAGGDILITNYKNGDIINTTDIVLEGTAPKSTTLIVEGGLAETEGTAKGDGTFAIPLTLDPTKKDFTIVIRDEVGRSESEPLTLKLDNTPPTIEAVEFSPQKPATNEKILIMVVSEPGLASVTVKPDQATAEVSLVENQAKPGTYQGFFNAATEPGAMQPVIRAVDSAKNATELRSILTIGEQGLPKVVNVKAEPGVNAVTLMWDAVGTEVTGYRIYVGESPVNFLYTLDTGRPTTKATVAGLSSGKIYYFAITALKGPLEGAEKSDIVQAQVLGLQLEVKPQDSALLLGWPTLSTQVPLSSFLLEYGTEPDKFTEQRLINGQLRTYLLKDLLNGVTYYLRLTPVTVTGEQLKDLAATGEGTPNGTGFNASPDDPIPFDPSKLPTPPKGGTLSQQGIPSFLFLGAFGLAALGAAAAYWHRRRLRHSEVFLRKIQSRYSTQR